MDCRTYRDAIHELVDGTLGSIRRVELQQHLDGCAGCRALADDLAQLRRLADSLEQPVPPDGIWLQIAGRLHQEGRVRPSAIQRSAGRHVAWVGIAAALVLAVVSALLLLRGLGTGTEPAMTQAERPESASSVDAVESVAAEFKLAEQHYQNAIAKLEEATRGDQTAIEPEVAAILQKNLQMIDQAIAESRAALNAEPQSLPARTSLFDALKRKVVLLQDTIALMNEMGRGDAAGAAIVEGRNKS